jgi:membrane protein YqaA with SNARE-associated domain
VYTLNLLPAFAPPTWLAISYVGFRAPGPDLTFLALVGALAATLGRVTLAKMARVVIRQRLMGPQSRENVDAIRQRLEGSKKLTFGVFLFYAFTPFPSNFLFVAYGLTAMDLTLIAVPFFIGRTVSYSFLALTSSAVSRLVSTEATDLLPYLSIYFVLSQVGLLVLVWVFTKIDWRALLETRKFHWLGVPEKSGPGC